jgi:Mlc titration factor MtfA (ptsG expression regulator)
MGGLDCAFMEKFCGRDLLTNTDGRNLGLHEMAHALRLENAIRNEEYGFLDDDILMTWTDLCYRKLKNEYGESDFFRAYATANSQEFFAVAVENFFERPTEFRDWHPNGFMIRWRKCSIRIL